MSWSQRRSKEQEYKLAWREYAGKYQVDSHRAFVVSLALRGEVGYIDVAGDLSADLTQSKVDEFKDRTTLIRFIRDQRRTIQGLSSVQENAPEVFARVSNIEREIATKS